MDIKRESFCASGSTELPYIIGNIMHNATQMYLHNFSKTHFKHIHASTKMASREFNRKQTKNLLVKNKPILSIVPRADFKESNLFAAYTFSSIHPLAINKVTDKEMDHFMVHILKDRENGIRLAYTPTIFTLQMEFTEIYETREQQWAAWWASSPLFDLEPCQREMYIKFPIPERFIYKVAGAMGIKYTIDKGVEDPLEFCRLMNIHSAYPLYYEKDPATGNYRYMVTVKTVYGFKFNKADKDDGERKGNIEDNFRVTRTVEVDVQAPHAIYFMYKDSRWHPDGVIDPSELSDIVPINTIKYDWLPKYRNERYIQGYSLYAFDTEGEVANFNVKEILFDEAYQAYCKALEVGSDVDKLLDVVLYVNREESTNFTFDRLTGQITIPNGSINDKYVISTYASMPEMKSLMYKYFDENYIGDGKKI